jgi:hypothetical protein
MRIDYMTWIALCAQVPVSLGIIAYLLFRLRRAELDCDVLRDREAAYAMMINRERKRSFVAHADQAVAVTRIAPMAPAYVVPTAKQLTEWARYANRYGVVAPNDTPTVVRRKDRDEK